MTTMSIHSRETGMTGQLSKTRTQAQRKKVDPASGRSRSKVPDWEPKNIVSIQTSHFCPVLVKTSLINYSILSYRVRTSHCNLFFFMQSCRQPLSLI